MTQERRDEILRDMAVLEHIQQCSLEARVAFGRALIALWTERSKVQAWSFTVTQYEVGDYALAATQVKTREVRRAMK
jgi:hypothetical protein